MKNFTKKSMLFALGVLTAASASAANYAWPEKYEGVMLQGFYWDSYQGTNNTKWTTLTGQADELSKYFSLIWVPNGAKCANSPSMGYDPVYWFTNYNSSFGNESQLRTMIKTFKEKGTGIIADVVINHRSGKSNWTDFPAETWNGVTYQLGPQHICSTDEVRNASGQARPTGAPDTGEDFNGSRDLDHTSAEVQRNCKAYCQFLLQDMGFTGFRYDMVKGYGGQYTKIYNEAAKPTFSVGEYWDGNYDAVKYWIESTGRQSAAFDFPCKYAINEAFHNNDMTKLVWKANGTTDQPAGMIHFAYSQYAVTFVDNHDTYRDGSKFNGNVVAANAFILCSPGTPCVFWPHYVSNKAAIQKLISIRNSCGITNTSSVKVLKSTRDCYMAEVYGTKGTLVVKIGSAQDSPNGYSNSDIKASGNDYCVWTKTTVNDNPTPTPTPTPGKNVSIYYDNSVTIWSNVNCYNYTDGGEGTVWPGDAMTSVGNNIYKIEVPEGWNVVFNNNSAQTVNVLGVQENHIYKGLAQTETGEFGNPCNLVQDGGVYNGGNNPTPTPTPTPGSYTIYFDNTNSNWTSPHIHYWGASESTWPGVAMTKVTGNVWSYDVPEGTTGCLFNAGDGDATKTADFVAVANHIYNTTGDQGSYINNPTPTPTPGNYPAALYLIGNVNGTSWATATGVFEQNTLDDGVYTWSNVTIDDAGDGSGYFSFLTQKDSIDGSWEEANNADRYGAPAKDTPIAAGQTGTVTLYAKDISAMGAEAWMAAAGKYDIVVNLKDMTINIENAGLNITGIGNIEDIATPRYFNLQGVEVINPENGIYIVVRGNSVTKEYIVK